MRYAMVIDIRRCIGCNACTVACKQKNATSKGIFYTRVLISEVGKYPSARMVATPILCMHCKEPECERVCPTGATYKMDNGIVRIDAEKCIGCRSCIIACPYSARFFNYGKTEPYYAEKAHTAFESLRQKDFISGTVGKCDFCFDRVEAGLEPSCVQTCPAKARIFGDLDDPNSKVSELIASRSGYQLFPALGTDPSIYYLPG